MVAWPRQLDDLMVALRDAKGPTEERRALLEARDRLVDVDHLERVRGGGSGPLRTVPGIPAVEEDLGSEDGNTSITDMRHRVVPGGEGAHLPTAFWQIVAYEGRIVEACSA